MEDHVLTFDPGESLLRGQIPLKEFGDILKKQDETKVVKIDFSRNGYCNDAVLRLILSNKKKDYCNLKEVILDGCILITNAGIKWLSEIITGASMLQKLVLDGCTNIGDNELYLLSKNIGPMCEVYMRGTFIRYVSELEKSKVRVDGCPLVGTEVVVDINCSHSFVFPHKSMENSLCHLIKDQKKVEREPLHYMTDFENNGWSHSISEMNLEHPLVDVMMSSNPVQVIIPFDEKADVKEVKQHITDTVVKVVSKAAFSTDFRKGREKLEKSSNIANHYGTARIKLLKLAHKLDVAKEWIDIFGDDGSKKGQLECSIHLCQPNGEIIQEQEPLVESKQLLFQELFLKVKISVASGLSADIESSFCKFKFFHIFNQYVKTVELPGVHPKYDFEHMFHSKVVRQRLLRFLEKASLHIEVWTRAKSENKIEITEDVKAGDNSDGMKIADNGSEYRPCEFIVLENGKKGDKLQQVKLTPEMFQPTLKEISTNIETQEKNLKDLDLHGQYMYSSLCKTRDAIQDFCSKQIEKIHYVSADLTSNEGSDKLLKKMSTIMDYHKYHIEGKYSMSHGRKRIMKTLLDIIQNENVMDFDSSGKVGSEDRDLKITGHEIMQLAKTLHEQGKIAIVTLGLMTVFVDINFLQTVFRRLSDTSNMQPCGKMSTCIGELSKVWTSEMVETHLWKDLKIPTDLPGEIFQEYFGLIEVPAWRFNPEDTQFLYTMSNVICPTPVSLNDFWKKDDSNKDFVVMKKTYSFVYPVSSTLLSGIQSSATYYGRTLLLAPEGAVFQIGCIQTAIMKDTGHLGYNEISVESKCYLPDRKAGPVNTITESYVQEYTWNVFCLYTDVVEKILKQCNIVCSISAEIPVGLVNISVGCKHNWQSYPERPSQSVCTLCNKCCDKGRKCPYNGVMGKYLRECSCKTCVYGCESCGICMECVEKHWNIRSFLRPLAMTYNIDKEKVLIAEKEERKKNETAVLDQNKEDFSEDSKIEMEEESKEEEEDIDSNPFEHLFQTMTTGEEEKEKSATTYFQVPLDPVAFNEFEVQHIHNGFLGIVLRECSTEQGERIVVFPGKAMAIQVEDIDELAMAEKISSLTSGITSYRYKFNHGDTIKVKISDPYRKLVKKRSSYNLSDQTKVSRVVYHPAVCTEAIISHETGVLCYHTEQLNTTANTPKKAYIIGSKPFSEKFQSFSIKILNHGILKYIGLGVSGNKSFELENKTGKELRKLRKADFIKYYINKGGVYNQKGCFEQKEGSDKGDIITVNCDVINKKLKFLRNDELITEVDLEGIPYGGYYPQISLNSEGESVQLLEKSPWGPDPNRIKGNPPAFNMHKYSNLWISPATNIMMTTRKAGKGETNTEQTLNGWIILHNPTNQQIGYSIGPQNFVNDSVGCLEPGESKPFHVKCIVKGKGLNLLETGMNVTWIILEQHDTYNVKTISEIFKKTSSTNINQHRLNCVGKSSNQGDTEALPLFNDVFESDGDNYKLKLYKNSRFVNSYCLKKGKYVLDLYSLFKGKEPEYIIKRPKCPSFLYPSSLQKGMQCIIKLQRFVSKDEFADGLITEKQERGYRIECTAEREVDFTSKDRIFYKEGNVGVSDQDWSKIDNIKDISEVEMYPMETCVSNKRASLSKTYIPAPPYLITKGSAELRELLNPEWQIHALSSFSSCSQSIARPTVQELSIASHSRGLLKWLKHREKTIPQTSVFLPAKLDSITMMYPQISTMFSDVSIYRLCFFHEKFWSDKNRQIIQARTKSNRLLHVKSLYNNQKKHYIVIHVAKRDKLYLLKNPQEVNLHLMDIPPYSLKKPALVDISYGCLYQAWTYVALLAYPLLVHSYGQMLPGGTGDLGRQQIESLLYQLIQPFASLCGIYSAQYGGLSNQLSPSKYNTRIKDLCSHPKIPIAAVENLTEKNLTDSHLFFELSSLLTCKAHYHGFHAQNLIPTTSDFSLEKKYFQPFSENLNSLIINGQELKNLPSDIFETFKNLYILSLVDVILTDTAVLPPGISHCKNLEIVCFSSVQGLKEVSKDLLKGPALTTFYLHNTPIRKLDIDWPITSMLTSLSLAGLLIEEVPKGVGQLEKLQELVLDYNPITGLPDELENLQKLKTLSVKGIPWITETTTHTLPKGMFEAWHQKNPYALNYLSHETIDKLFHKYDVNSNNVLDPTELANLNMYLMMRIPRLGLKSLDDKDFGMVPPVVFKLKSLTKLDLSYSAITYIPDKVKNLLKLQYFNLEHCPILDSISGQLGLLPNLGSIYLNSCPLLETPPLEIVGRGFDAIKAFLKRIAAGFTECHRTKLMFIGLGQAGKTTLLEALRSDKKMTLGSIDAKLTDGIEIKPWIVPINYEGKQINITYSCWDFAGQTVYYNTHQFFLSKQAVYMLLWNMRMGFEHAGLDFWMSSVACHCPEAPVIVVGTQLDQIPMPDIPEAEIMEKYPQIKKFCYVSSTQGTNIPELEEALIDITMNHCTQMQMKIPKVWLSFENGILKERDGGMNIMDWWDIKQCAIKNGIYDVKDIRLAVQFLNDLGTVQYFDTDFLRNKVVINPQWIVDVMAKVVSVNEKSIKETKGRFYHKFVSEIWKDYEPNLHEWMLKLTERFDLTFPIPDSTEDKFNIVPCLLPETRPKNLQWPYLSEDEGFRESTILYKFTYLPTGLFNRAQARLFNQGFTDEKLLDFMWKKGSILRKNQHYALVKQVNDFEMIVSVQGPRPKNVMDLIHETISTLIKDAFVGVDYDYYIQCPDCVEKEGTKDPFLFKADLISRAHSVNAPFLQCTKFFHTVSIAELLRIMPESKETEFDTQIQESISTLEEINSNMATDVAILYSPADIKRKQTGAESDPVDPRNIYKDLKNAGYNCWFPADMSNTTELEMTLAVKNSKVLVVCMSDNFVRYQKCHKMFLYATEQLHKPFAVAAITESLGWQQTDLGFKIGNPKMAMIKNAKRYPEKIKDLIDIVKTHIDDLEKMKLSTPSVFVSYCWKNSKEACSVTTQATPGSLGYGDPRALKKYLENDGNRCWLDIEQMGKFGLYQDITVGLQNSKVLVICVSDEYLQSDACMMEARFGVYNMLLPIVVCVVGTGKSWKDSEISLMIHRQGDLAKVVKMQKMTPEAYETVLTYVRNYLERPETEKQRKVRERLEKVKLKQEKQKKEDLDRKLKQQGDTNFSYQEEIELIQRKFMRYVSRLSLMEETDIPRLLVVDFTEQKQSRDTALFKELQNTNQDNARSLSEAINDASKDNSVKAQNMYQTLLSQVDQPSKDEEGEKMSSKEPLSQSQGMMDILNECLENKWEGQDLCLRVLCEYEQGWHFHGISFDLDKLISGPENVNKLIKEAAPYLARFCTILKQSGVDLNCEGSPTGESFLSYIRKEGTSTKNFTEAYRMLCKSVEEFLDKDNWWLDNFPKCCLPNGKVAYLCEEHMRKVGAIIQHGTETSGYVRDLLSEQDKYLKEVLSENTDIKRMKANRGNISSKQGGARKVKIEKKGELSQESPKEKLPDEPAKTEKPEQPTETSNVERPVSPSESSVSSVTSAKGVHRQKSQRRTSQACSIQ